jgi:hypothetical protein
MEYSGECCSFVEHGFDSPPEGSNALALHAAHLGIKFPLQRLLERQQLTEVRPTQLLRQRGKNLFTISAVLVFAIVAFTVRLIVRKCIAFRSERGCRIARARHGCFVAVAID